MFGLHTEKWGILFQPMVPTSLVSVLHHGQTISRKTSGDWNTQVSKPAPTRTEGLRERLTTEALLTLSCQLHVISFNIIWTLFCCQKCVEISETEGLAARSNSCTKSNVMLSTRNYSPLAWGNLPSTHRVRDPHPSENSQCSGPASLETTKSNTILNHHSTMVLLISNIYFLDHKKWRKFS